MAGSFHPKFVDLVRNLTATSGTANFLLGDTPTGFKSFASSLQAGDMFYYSAVGIERPGETEVGRGTMQADGTIARRPTTGALTNFSDGLKSVSLVAAAEWFDKIENRGWVSLTDFGGVADCTAVGAGTDNSAAFRAAVDMLSATGGGTLFIPRGRYRFSSRPALTEGVILQGEGHRPNPSIVSGVSFEGVNIYEGTILVFDFDVAGPIFYEYAGDEEADVVAAEVEVKRRASKYFKYRSARLSGVRDLMLHGGGGTTSAPNGLETRTVVHVENVSIIDFAGSGFVVDASTSGAGVPYGNASMCRFVGCSARGNWMHGFWIRGIDANVIAFESCDSANNGGIGFFDQGFLGNTYISCHAATNNANAFQTDPWRSQILVEAPETVDPYVGSFYATGTVAPHVFVGCYTEGGLGGRAHLLSPSAIYGGILSQAGSMTPASTALVLNGAGGRSANLGVIDSPGGSLRINHGNGSSVDVCTDGVSTLRLLPGTGAYTNIKLFSSGDSIAGGLDILAGSGAGYLSADSIVLRDAAQAKTFLTAAPAGVLASVPIGYGTGAGGAVTQSSGKSTGVSLNAPSGQITMSGAALAANTGVSFTLTNNQIGANDVVSVVIKSGASADTYAVNVDAVGAGSCRISLRNLSATSKAEALVLGFAVTKGALA